MRLRCGRIQRHSNSMGLFCNRLLYQIWNRAPLHKLQYLLLYLGAYRLKWDFSVLKNETTSQTLQHTATHCNTLQRTATQCNTLQLDRTVTHKIVSLSTKDRTFCRVAKTHRMPIFPGHFPFKFLIISGCFRENDLHLMVSYGSSPPCIRERFLEMRL